MADHPVACAEVAPLSVSTEKLEDVILSDRRHTLILLFSERQNNSQTIFLQFSWFSRPAGGYLSLEKGCIRPWTRRGELVARKLFARSSIPFAVLMGLALAAPAQAQDPLDVAALEARLEAAGELAELPTEPDWGVTDPLASDAATPQDAPEVPVESAAEPAADATEPRYHPRGPQYHAEYHPSAPEPVAPELPPVTAEPAPVAEPAAPPVDDARDTPRPAEAPAPAETPTAPPVAPAASAPAPAPAPASTPAPAPATPSATPTIWIWIWNWNWTQLPDGRYHNSGTQYQVDEPLLDPEVGEIVKNIGVEMPVQIDVRKGSDIVTEIQRGVSPEQAVKDVLAEGAKDTPLEEVLAPAAEEPTTSAPSVKRSAEPKASDRAKRKREAPGRARPPESAQQVLLRSEASSEAYFASGDVARASRHTGRSTARVRMHRVAAPKSPLPTNDERLADTGTASGPNAGFVIKTSAILAAFLMLAALAYGRRLWLPATRLRGLLGSRAEPPG
jgi:hypothetical protein